MAKHRVTLGRRGIAALAAAGALVIGGATATMIGTGNADVIDALTAGATTTTVLPDLSPFTDMPPDADTRGDGKAEVTDEFGAPDGGHKAALKLSTPADADKVDVIKSEGGSPLAQWVGNASYSALQHAADKPVQYPAYQLIIDYNGNGPADGGYSTLDYEPVYNGNDAAVPDQWKTYDVGTTGKLCSTKAIPGIIDDTHTRCDNGGLHTLAEYVAAAPNATVTAVQINQGSGNPGLISAVDLVKTPSATYDFELTKPVIIPPITDPTDTPTTHPTAPGGHGGGQWGGDGQWGDGSGDHPGGGWGDDEDHGNGNGHGGGHCGC